MSTRVVERVDDWTERAFSGGFRGLQELADADFSGVVRSGGAELYMTRGTVVGVSRGSIDDFEEGSGSAFEAPTDALPLLAVMQERSDEVRAKYYTEETGIGEVDRTLEDGGFTGFVELSENVLSGDYYLVYHQGRSMSVAFVGSAERLITDDEAFEKADGEVGIYEVRPVDVEPVEIPEPPEPPEDEQAGVTADPAGTAPAGAGDDGAAEPAGDDPDATASAVASDAAADGDAAGPAHPETTADAASEPNTGAIPADDAGANSDTPTGTDTGAEAASGASADGETTSADAETGVEPDADGDEASEAGVERDAVDDETTDRGEPDQPEAGEPADRDPDEAGSGEASTSPERDDAGSAREHHDGSPGSDGREGGAEAASDTAAGNGTRTASQGEQAIGAGQRRESEPQAPPERGTADRTPGGTSNAAATASSPEQLETRAIPSLDPELTSAGSHSGEQSRRDTVGGAGEPRAAGPKPRTDTQRERTPPEPATDTEEETSESQPDDGTAESAAEPEAEDRIEELQEVLSERESEIRQLESELETAESERESLREELAAVREERDELQDEVRRLEEELSRLEEELGAATDAQQRMTPQEALSGTDLFVRYRSKGDATLEKAHGNGNMGEAVADNIQLERHTQFDADVAAVGGRDFDAFLEETPAYRFVHWVVYELLFEIQKTGHTESLGDLYDALPKINRVELNGAVTTTYTEDGQERESTESFDVVFRERMGDPLLVADINESRQGATQGMMEQLITSAERVGTTTDDLAAAFLVTESFFEPEALETVAEATRSGILSRDKRTSFVNLSRKRGYHLCLVEARNENFHLEVPEL